MSGNRGDSGVRLRILKGDCSTNGVLRDARRCMQGESMTDSVIGKLESASACSISSSVCDWPIKSFSHSIGVMARK